MHSAPSSTSRLLGAALVLSLTTISSSCRATGVRAVVSDRPLVASHDITVRTAVIDALDAAVPPSFDPSEEPLVHGSTSMPSMRPMLSLSSTTPAPGSPTSDPGAFDGGGPLQLDATLGPVDLGYRVLVDLGAGEAPYDDAVSPIHSVEPRRGGFSDSVIQVSLRESLGPHLRLHGTAAVSRTQELSLLDSLPEADFTWFVVGLQLAW